MKYLIDKLINFAKRKPYEHIGDYMERYWIIPYNKFFPAIRIHHIKQSDQDGAYHDHPWWYISIILKGGYKELSPIFDKSGLYKGIRAKYYKAGNILFRRAKSWHRIELDRDQPVWTLFITGHKSQEWGFLKHPKNKIYYRDYLK